MKLLLPSTEYLQRVKKKQHGGKFELVGAAVAQCRILLSSSQRRALWLMYSALSRMSNTLADSFWLCLVSLLWGSTNPLIRKGSKGIEEIHKSSRIQQFFAEVIFLASNWRYMVPFLLNQCGSVIFYLTLASVDLSIAVPITNSLTMLITTLAGRILGEGKINAGTFFGMVLVISGVSVCVTDKA